MNDRALPPQQKPAPTDATDADAVAPPPPRPVLSRFLASLGWAPRAALVVLAIIVVVTLLSPWLAPYDPLSMDPLTRLKGPSAEHWLGTDNFGRDLFSRVLIGGRISLLIGIGAAVVSVILGLAIGMVAGFFRTADAIIMRLMDALMAIPAILLAIALSVVVFFVARKFLPGRTVEVEDALNRRPGRRFEAGREPGGVEAPSRGRVRRIADGGEGTRPHR